METPTLEALQAAAAAGVAAWGFAVVHTEASAQQVTVAALQPNGAGCSFSVQWAENEAWPTTDAIGAQFSLVAQRFLYGDDPPPDPQ